MKLSFTLNLLNTLTYYTRLPVLKCQNSSFSSWGGWYLLGVQTLTCACLLVWSLTTTVIILWVVNQIIPIRMSPYEELLGADLAEHQIRHRGVGVSRALSQLQPFHSEVLEVQHIEHIGSNPGHEVHLKAYVEQRLKQLRIHSAPNRIHPTVNKFTEISNKKTDYLQQFAWTD